MNPLKKRYIDKYGETEPYTVLKIEIAIIATLIISLASEITSTYIYIFNLATAAVLIHSMYSLKKEYPGKFIKYLAIFSSFYTVAFISPMVLLDYSMPMDPTGLNMMLGALVALLIIFIIIRTATSQKGVKAKVLLADEEIAVVKPEYDLISGVKPKKYVVDNKNASKGDKVITTVSKTPFKKPEPRKIKKVVK